MIKDYRVISKWTNVDSGSAEWCFARKDNKEWFVKRFLSPVYPDKEIRMSQDLRQRKEARFNAYQQRKKKIYDKVAEADNGNLVLTEELFRFGNHLYMSSARVPFPELLLESAAYLPKKIILTIVKSLIDSVKHLHDVGVVHADIRPENILIKPTFQGYYAAKMIDFDNSFLSNNPPSDPSNFSLDPVYAAPESIRFLYGEPLVLDRGIDVFSLGLLIHLLLSGELPGYDDNRYNYLSAAINDGQTAKLSSSIDSNWQAVIRLMLSARPEDRPKMADIHQAFILSGHKPVKEKAEVDARSTNKKNQTWRAAPGDLSTPW